MSCHIKNSVCRALSKGIQRTSGQSSVEAAFILPVLFITLLILLQPGIILYDRMVMNAAAAEGCRYLATFAPSEGMSGQRAQELIARRLGAIPEQDLFHVHEPCSYEVELSGDETSGQVTVRVSNAIKPLPLLGIGASAFGVLNESGNYEITVESHEQTQPNWVGETGIDPEGWINAREDGR